MTDPQDKGPVYPGRGSGQRTASNVLATGVARSPLQAGRPAQNGWPAGRRTQTPPQDVRGSRNDPESQDVPGSKAPKASYDGPDPRALAGLFQQAKGSGDIERAKGMAGNCNGSSTGSTAKEREDGHTSRLTPGR